MVRQDKPAVASARVTVPLTLTAAKQLGFGRAAAHEGKRRDQHSQEPRPKSKL